MDGRDNIRPSVTRFATNFVLSENFYSRRVGVKRMFTFTKWNELKWCTFSEGLIISNITDEGFWKNAYKVEVIQVRCEPPQYEIKISICLVSFCNTFIN